MYKMLIAGMLVMAPAVPALAVSMERTQLAFTSDKMLSGDLVHRLLTKAASELEAQLSMSLTVDFLYQEYEDGNVTITYLGHSGSTSYYQVSYLDGGVGIADVMEF